MHSYLENVTNGNFKPVNVRPLRVAPCLDQCVVHDIIHFVTVLSREFQENFRGASIHGLGRNRTLQEVEIITQSSMASLTADTAKTKTSGMTDTHHGLGEIGKKEMMATTKKYTLALRLNCNHKF